MFVDGRTLDGDVEADVCIIGAGAAGISAALELAQTKLDVVLLESGGRQIDPEIQKLGQVRQTGQATDDVGTSRMRVFGGTTTMWGGQVRPFDAIDFEKRDWVPHSGWPIRRNELLPAYERALKICKLTETSYDVENYAGPRLEDARFENIVYQWSFPSLRFGTAYEAEFERAKNIRAIVHATVVRLDTNDQKTTITRARVANLAQKRFEVRAKHFIVACGAVQSARLLLVSQVGGDLVGRYFMQHPQVSDLRLMMISEQAARRFDRGVKREPGAQTRVQTRVRPDVQAAERLLNTHYWYVGEVAVTDPSAIGSVKTAARDFKSGYGLRIPVARIVADLVAPGEDPDHAKVLEATLVERPEQAPNPDSRITLDDERDALGVPLAVMDWKLTELDRRSLDRCRTLLAQTLGAQRIGRLRIMDDRPPWQSGVVLHGGFHHMGTARMASSATEGVVDANQRVHGVENLHLCGGAVFPTSGYANPTLTIVATAVRLARHLLASAT